MIRRLATAAGLLTLVAVMVAAVLFAQRASATPAPIPKVVGNFLVDQDHNLAFPQNKQNEPAITRDPLTGVLIAGANDEIGNNLCPGTTAPLTSPCPFTPGAPTSAFYRSSDNGQTWSSGFLPGFDTIGRVSGG